MLHLTCTDPGSRSRTEQFARVGLPEVQHGVPELLYCCQAGIDLVVADAAGEAMHTLIRARPMQCICHLQDAMWLQVWLQVCRGLCVQT